MFECYFANKMNKYNRSYEFSIYLFQDLNDYVYADLIDYNSTFFIHSGVLKKHSEVFD